uniref:Uncharacterized protein n=1 Tax=Streptomyces sp. NBC_00180 TaxID=2903632 RepID=A0AAU1I7W0_9ACTN
MPGHLHRLRLGEHQGYLDGAISRPTSLTDTPSAATATSLSTPTARAIATASDKSPRRCIACAH